jgi:hypothetical protein
MRLPLVWSLLSVLGIAILFYLAVPGVGAFLARAQWRRFRRRLLAVSLFPTANPARMPREKASLLGEFRFFGTLEAIQGDERIWITNGRLSVAADLGGLSVYILPRQGGPRVETEREGEIRSVPWGRVFSLPEGTPILVCGALYAEDGRPVFRSRGRRDLLVVIHDCPREAIIQRATWSGRQRNEYINAFTLPSVVTGSLSLALLAYSRLSAAGGRLAAIAAITAALGPLIPFLPPGFPLYFAYRRAWRRARLMRAQRDVVRLPLRYFPPEDPRPTRPRRPQQAALLPDMEPYVMLRGTVCGQDAPAISTGGMEVRLPAGMERIRMELPRRAAAGGGKSVAFGCYRETEAGIELHAPEDPMAQLILVPGEPQALADACSAAARRLEIVSALFVCLDVAVNVPLLFLLLSLAIR